VKVRVQSHHDRVLSQRPGKYRIIGGLTHPDFTGMHAFISKGAQTGRGVSRNPLIQDQAYGRDASQAALLSAALSSRAKRGEKGRKGAKRGRRKGAKRGAKRGQTHFSQAKRGEKGAKRGQTHFSHALTRSAWLQEGVHNLRGRTGGEQGTDAFFACPYEISLVAGRGSQSQAEKPGTHRTFSMAFSDSSGEPPLTELAQTARGIVGNLNSAVRQQVQAKTSQNGTDAFLVRTMSPPSPPVTHPSRHPPCCPPPRSDFDLLCWSRGQQGTLNPFFSSGFHRLAVLRGTGSSAGRHSN